MSAVIGAHQIWPGQERERERERDQIGAWDKLPQEDTLKFSQA